MTTDVLFGATPGIKKVSFAGIPFFAITHDTQSPAQEFVISSAGFWVQEASNEILLTRRPRLRRAARALCEGHAGVQHAGVGGVRRGGVRARGTRRTRYARHRRRRARARTVDWRVRPCAGGARHRPVLQAGDAGGFGGRAARRRLRGRCWCCARPTSARRGRARRSWCRSARRGR